MSPPLFLRIVEQRKYSMLYDKWQDSLYNFLRMIRKNGYFTK